MIGTDAIRGVIAVGDGRGFVVQGVSQRYVITAAHCLPHLPPAHTCAHEEEKIYRLLALRHGPGPTVTLNAHTRWEGGQVIQKTTTVPTLDGGADVERAVATCLFVNPVADIAVLGQPDNQALWDEADVFDSLVEAVPAFRVAHPQLDHRHSPPKGSASLVSLNGELMPCTIRRYGATLLTYGARTVGGMSGSPIIAPDGSAVGIVVVGSNGPYTGDGPHPILTEQLPGWLLNELAPTRRRRSVRDEKVA